MIKSFIDKYAMHRLQYGIISYGSTPKIELSLEDSLKPDVKQRVEAIRLPRSTPELAKSLQLGEQLLISGRPNADKVLVVITDVKSGSSPRQIKLVAEYLDNKDIRVFAVAIGSEADSAELAIASGSKKNVMNSSNTDEPGRIREHIMDKIRQGSSSEIMRFPQENALSVPLRVTHFQFLALVKRSTLMTDRKSVV